MRRQWYKCAFFIFFMANLLLVHRLCKAQEGPKEPLSPRQESREIERGGVLLPKGALMIEPGFQYSHTSRARISISGFTIFEAIVIGEIVSEEVKRDILMPFVNFRYGITDRLEATLKVPWLYRRDEESWVEDSTTVERTVDDTGLGDIEGALYYHLIREKGAIPDMVVNLRVKSPTGKDPYHLSTDDRGKPTELPTGNGHWGVSVGLSLSKTSDPAVLFASANYYYNFERDVGGSYGKVKPGDSFEYGLGLAYALNEKLSASLSYQQRLYWKTRQNGEDVPGTDLNVATLNFGISYVLSQRTSVNITVGVGLTHYAPDVTVEITIPIRVF